MCYSSWITLFCKSYDQRQLNKFQILVFISSFTFKGDKNKLPLSFLHIAQRRGSGLVFGGCHLLLGNKS